MNQSRCMGCAAAECLTQVRADAQRGPMFMGEVSCVDGATAATVTAIGSAMARSTLTPWRRRPHSGSLAGVARLQVRANTCAGRLARCVLVGHLARGPAIGEGNRSPTDGAGGAGTGATQMMAALVGTFAASVARSTPHEGGRVCVPAAGGLLQPCHDLLG